MFTNLKKRKGLETVEWVGIGVVLVAVAIGAYRVFGGRIGQWLETLGASI